MKKFDLSKYRKSFPWIPIIGIPLVMIYQLRYRDVLSIEDKPIQFVGSAFFQSLCVYIPILIISFLI